MIFSTDRTFLSSANEEEDEPNDQAPAFERIQAGKKAKKRHVWKIDGDLLRAIEVQVGISDNRFSELVTGDLEEGMVLVTGQKAKGEK